MGSDNGYAPAWLARQTSLIGGEKNGRLHRASVLVVGVGGVGGAVVEALARAGVGKLTLIDHDTVSLTNLNRQIIADLSTVGRRKVDAFAERIARINPECTVLALPEFFGEENAERIFSLAGPDYVVDAIDTVTSKVVLAKEALSRGIPFLASMGTGNKLDPSRLRVTDAEKTSVCPLARVMRQKYREAGLKHVRVLWSDEPPVRTGERVPASISFLPPAAGLLIASHVIRTLIAEEGDAETVPAP